ncbi:MAG: type II toxin-antitoxin system RelE/ParE family toxin [Pseudomonadales bacterium]|jgi:hypothetical protein
MADSDYQALQEALISRPDLGVIIQGTGGLRKVRWKLEDKGKRGGVRAIYYWLSTDEQIYMLYVYTKAEQEALTAEQKKLLKLIVARWSDEK